MPRFEAPSKGCLLLAILAVAALAAAAMYAVDTIAFQP